MIETRMLIHALAQDRILTASPGVLMRRAMWAANAVVGVVFFSAIGLRADIASASETVRFLLKFAFTLPLAITATIATTRSLRPDYRFQRADWTLAISPLLLTTAVLVELTIVPSSSWITTMVGSNARNCLTLIPLLALGPLACILLAARRGAPSRPILTGALAGLAASGIAATFYATNCTDDSPLFVMTWYPLATMLVVSLGMAAGNRWLRW